MRTLALIVSVFLAVFAACGTSPQVGFVTLGAAPGPRRPLPPLVAAVQVAAVHLPPSLDRRELVTHSGAHEVDVDARHRWSAPLADMTRNVLSQDLRARLPAGAVVMPDMPAPQDTGEIVVSLSRFGADASQRATLQGSWSLSHRGGVRVRRDVAFSAPLDGSGAEASASAMSDLLGQLATDIATNLGNASGP
jgi:uncharacterized lipoprotein YmbA